MFEEFKGTEIPIPMPKKPSGDFLKKLPKIVLIVVISLVLLAAVASSWYTVNDKEQAVVTRLHYRQDQSCVQTLHRRSCQTQ